ncbi:hypothetical protein MRX96_024586 [Rhipicephalus microplus]
MEPIDVGLRALEVPEVGTVNGPTLEPSVIAMMRDHNLAFADAPQGDHAHQFTISVLIGSDHYLRVATRRVERFTDTLCAVEAIFGWVIGAGDATSSIGCPRITSVPCFWLVPTSGALQFHLKTHQTSGACTPSVSLTEKTT